LAGDQLVGLAAVNSLDQLLCPAAQLRIEALRGFVQAWQRGLAELR